MELSLARLGIRLWSVAKLVFICDRLLCSVDLFFTGPTPLVGFLSGGLVGQEPDV